MTLLIQVVDKLFLIFTIMIFVRIFASWFPEFRNSSAFRFISFYTDPYLNLFRKIIPPLGMFDLSPIVALVILRLCEGVVKSFLMSLAW